MSDIILVFNKLYNSYNNIIITYNKEVKKVNRVYQIIKNLKNEI